MVRRLNPFGLPPRYAWLSTDKEPTSFIANGSIGYVEDTGEKKVYSREDGMWYIKPENVPGAIDGLFPIRFETPPVSMDNTDYVTTLSTDDIDAARAAGNAVIAVLPTGAMCFYDDTGGFAFTHIYDGGLVLDTLVYSEETYQHTEVKPTGVSYTTTYYGYEYTENIPVEIPTPEETVEAQEE